MKGNKKLITILNSLLINELTVINQDMVHAEMCANWGYNNLHMVIRKRAMDEMQHAGWLIERIINLNGMPALTGINRINLGKTVPEMISNDNLSEIESVRVYKDAINFAREVDDYGSADLLVMILKMKENHVKWTEKQIIQIIQMGLEKYLATQTMCPIPFINSLIGTQQAAINGDACPRDISRKI